MPRFATAVMLSVAPCPCVRANLARALPVDMHRLLRGLSGHIRDLHADHLGGGRSIPVAAQSSVLRRPETGATRLLARCGKSQRHWPDGSQQQLVGQLDCNLPLSIAEALTVVLSLILPMLMMETWRSAAIRRILLFGLIVWYIFGGGRGVAKSGSTPPKKTVGACGERIGSTLAPSV